MVGRFVGASMMSDREVLVLGRYGDGNLDLQNHLGWYCLAESRQAGKADRILAIPLRYLRHQSQTLASLARQGRRVSDA